MSEVLQVLRCAKDRRVVRRNQVSKLIIRLQKRDIHEWVLYKELKQQVAVTISGTSGSN